MHKEIHVNEAKGNEGETVCVAYTYEIPIVTDSMCSIHEGKVNLSVRKCRYCEFFLLLSKILHRRSNSVSDDST